MFRQRGWFWTPLFDRWQVLAALLLAALFVLLTIRFDRTPPAPVFTEPAANAQLTAAALGDAAGTARANDTVRLFAGDTALGDAKADAGGQWRLPLTNLTPGQHTLLARIVDANGKVLASSQPRNITVAPAATPTPAVMAPIITAPAPGAQLTAGNLGDLAGSGRAGDTLRIHDGDKEIGQATVGPDGAWRFPFPALTSGAHAITARVVDANGNVQATSQPLNISIVNAATPGTTTTPGVTPGSGGTPGVTPGSGSTPGVTPGSGGTPGVTPGSGGTPGATPGTTTTPAVTPTPIAGRVKAPVLTSALVSPLHTSRPLFRGTTEPGARVRIYDGATLLAEVTADAAGNWSFVPPVALAAGDHVLRLAAVDTDGSEVFADPLPFTIAADAQPLAPPTINLPPGGQLPAGERLTGTAPPDSTVTLYAGDKTLGAATVGPDGAWQFSVPADLPPGDYDFRAVVNDASGNLLGESLPARIKILPSLGLPTTGGDLSGQ
ncbi:MAG: Ig-like domain-containing protein [Anaerolineae bacterium]